MRKIIISLAMIVAIGAVVVTSTTAFFSDTETSTGNTFTAGSIDLKIDNESYYNGEVSTSTSWALSDLDDGEGLYNGQYLFFNFNDLKPGDWGEDTISLHVDNNDSWLCADVTLTSNEENNITEPEAKMNDDDTEGELAQEIWFVWWADDGDNVLEDNETPLGPYNLGAAPLGQPVSVALADSQINVWGEDGPLPGDSVRYIAKAWCFGDIGLAPVPAGDNNNPTINPGITCNGAPVDNMSQSDSATLDVAFSAIQSRNNLDYVCGQDSAPVVFQLTDQDGEHDNNQSLGQPYVTWNINGDEIEFTFHNPTGIANPFPFEYRIDDEVGAPIPGITGVTIPSGPYANGVWGNFYNFVSVGPNSSTTVTLTGLNKIQVRLVVGPERDYDFDWITFEAN